MRMRLIQAIKAVQRTPALQLAFVNVVRELGLAYIVAEEEADLQIGALYQARKVYAAITEDTDLYAHAVRRIFSGIRANTFVWRFDNVDL